MIRFSLTLAHIFLWLPMTLNLRKMRRVPQHVRVELVRMWAILFLKIAKIKVSMRFRNHIPLSTKTLIIVEDAPFIYECLLVALQHDCVLYNPKATPYGLPQKWLDVCRVTTLENLPTYCVILCDDLTQHELDIVAQQHVQLMKIKVQTTDTILSKPTKFSLMCGVPLSAEESAVASLNIVQQL